LLNYYSNLINTVVLTSDGVFVRKIGGNPSGSVNTITDNTLILFMLLAYGWIMCVPEELLSYECFMMEMSLALCGDDNTWSVSHLALPHFNAERLIAVWAKIGITTTTDSLVPRPVEELDFLSAFTVFVDGIAVPLYSREKILTSLLYSRFLRTLLTPLFEHVLCSGWVGQIVNLRVISKSLFHGLLKSLVWFCAIQRNGVRLCAKYQQKWNFVTYF